MGLDGISVNQLKITPEYNTKEKSELIKDFQNKQIDGLANSQKINSDEEGNGQNKGYYSSSDDNSNEEEEISEEIEDPQTLDYDLSNTKKYKIKVDDKTGDMIIIDVETQNIVQAFSPKTLTRLTQNLCSHKGIFVNRKY